MGDFLMDSKDSQLLKNQAENWGTTLKLPVYYSDTMQRCSKNVPAVFPKHVIFNTQRWFRPK